MLGYVENNYIAIIKPKKDLYYDTATLLREFRYIIVRQEEPISGFGLKRSLVQGFSTSVWIGQDIEENFEIVKVLRERHISEDDLKQAKELWDELKYVEN